MARTRGPADSQKVTIPTSGYTRNDATIAAPTLIVPLIASTISPTVKPTPVITALKTTIPWLVTDRNAGELRSHVST